MDITAAVAAEREGASIVATDTDSADLFSCLCGLTTFVTNRLEQLEIKQRLTPTEVSVLCSLLTSTASISHLILRKELPPGTAAILSSAIPASTVRTLTLGNAMVDKREPAPELFRLLANSVVKQLTIYSRSIDDDCNGKCDSLGVALRSLEINTIKNCSRCIPSLATSIGKLRALESLNIHGIADSGLEILAAALKDLPLLTDLAVCLDGPRGGQRSSISTSSATGYVLLLPLRSSALW